MEKRASGLLLHPTSLPGRWGIGDLGEEAYRFVDFLHDAGQSYWQILPLGPTGLGNSPYQCLSSFAGNPLLVSPEQLVASGLLGREALEPPDDVSPDPNHVDYDSVNQVKSRLLNESFRYFESEGGDHHKEAFRRFCESERDWLDDYALFVALKNYHEGKSWGEWEEDIVLRRPEAMVKWHTRLSEAVRMQQYLQYLFFSQWSRLKLYANERGIEIIGDMPVFVAYDGADVWSHPDLFFLDEHGHPTVVAGVPPDYFSPTGQLWGNPLYRWDRIANQGYRWWIDRVKGTLALVDVVRLDHFRGFEAYWEIPASEPTAVNGRWVKGPGENLFRAVERAVGKLPFIAEDLGLITPEVEALRDLLEQPGMKVLHFAFGDTSRNPYLPHNYVRNCVVYTGTHDNDTTLGWYDSLEDTERSVVQAYFGHEVNDVSWSFVRLAWKSVANTAIAPVQDLLRLGSESRMNTPGVGEGNWKWRLLPGQLTRELSKELQFLTGFYGRMSPDTRYLKDRLQQRGALVHEQH